MCSIQEDLKNDLNLNTSTTQWFTEFQDSWKYAEKRSALKAQLSQHFEQNENPYMEALRLMYNTPNFERPLPSLLAYKIMVYFDEWRRKSLDKIKHLLSSDIKIIAFKLVFMKKQFFNRVSEIYEMKADGDIFIGTIMEIIQEKHYEEACKYTSIFDLHNHFNIHDFFIPLILQNKISYIEEILMKTPTYQNDVVSFMDSFLAKPSSYEDYIKIYKIPKVGNKKLDKKYKRTWEKLIIRFLKKFQLSTELVPCLEEIKRQRGLTYILSLKFEEKSIDDEAWKELIEDAVKDDVNLQKQLVNAVALRNPSEALQWARIYHIAEDYWPPRLKNRKFDLENVRLQEQPLPPIVTKDCHKLNFQVVSIEMVKDIARFHNFLDKLQYVDIVGVDCEWKPIFALEKPKLAIMQVATRKCVYILDVISLSDEVDLWEKLNKCLFKNFNILKLGYGFMSDEQVITQSLSCLSINKPENFLDLSVLWKNIRSEGSSEIFPCNAQSDKFNLSALVELCLGKPLDKSNVFSNWEKRPLREKQLEYAALDAYCLIEIYEVLKSRSTIANFPFEKICEDLKKKSIKEQTTRRTNKKQKKKVRSN